MYLTPNLTGQRSSSAASYARTTASRKPCLILLLQDEHVSTNRLGQKTARFHTFLSNNSSHLGLICMYRIACMRPLFSGFRRTGIHERCVVSWMNE